jgi:DNA-binding NarL/FixJ family response regulator
MKTIVHIDNSEFFRKQVKTFLEKEGFEVESWAKWEDAAFDLSGGAVSMIITGLTVGDLDGAALIQSMLENFKGPIVVLSSNVDDKLSAKLKALGVKAALPKASNWQEELKPWLPHP